MYSNLTNYHSFYSETNETNKTNETNEYFSDITKHMVFTWTQNVVNLKQTNKDNFWGIGDIIRGMIRSYQLSKKYNISFNVDIQNHPISKYLEPVSHPYMNDLLYKKDNIPFIMSDDIESYINSNNGIIFFLTNAHFNEPITDECRLFIKSIFVPTSEFKSYMDTFLLPSNYVVYHYRFGDKEMIEGEETDYSSSVIHLTKNMNPIIPRILLSDSNKFKKIINEAGISIIIYNTSISHIGYHNDIKDTLFEFFILSKASHIYTPSILGWIYRFLTLITEL